MLPVAVLAALLVAPSAQANYRVGVGEQSGSMFDSARWQSLKLKRVRYLVPWTWNRKASTSAAVTAYMNRAHAAGQQVLVAFTARAGCYVNGRYSKRKACRAPSAAAYRASFRAFDSQFPWVKTYSAWNEVNHVSQPTARSPKLAVRYYNVLRKEARARRFRVMAADLLDTSNLRSYLRGFLRRAKGSPRLWGLHNYQDVNYRTSTDTRKMLRLVRGEVWLTETGGVVQFGRGFPYNLQRAAKALSYMFKLAASNPRLKRLYIYQWFGAPPHWSFDAGVVDINGNPRPGYQVVKDNLAP
jgi:hypothetical protein